MIQKRPTFIVENLKPIEKVVRAIPEWSDSGEPILVQIEEFVKTLLSKGKQIYVCGLDGDFERKKFGQILDLIPLCDKVNKLTSLCSICKNGTLGIFSKRISSEKEQTVVGSDNYIPVCRKCYEKNI